jgi:hypothetical protein
MEPEGSVRLLVSRPSSAELADGDFSSPERLDLLSRSSLGHPLAGVRQARLPNSELYDPCLRQPKPLYEFESQSFFHFFIYIQYSMLYYLFIYTVYYIFIFYYYTPHSELKCKVEV